MAKTKQQKTHNNNNNNILEKEMATHSSILAWDLVGYSLWGPKNSDTT